MSVPESCSATSVQHSETHDRKRAGSQFARVPWQVIDATKKLGPLVLAVYCAIARHADCNGVAWPSIRRIADVAGVSARKTQDCINKLIKAGFLERELRSSDNGSPTSSLYRLRDDPQPSGHPTAPDATPPALGAGPGARSAPGVPHAMHGDTASGADKQEPINKNQQKVNSASAPQPSDQREERRNDKFVPPTLAELQAFAKEAALNLDAEQFIDYYQSNGWKVGKNSMKDWKATARCWARRELEHARPQSGRTGTPEKSSITPASIPQKRIHSK